MTVTNSFLKKSLVSLIALSFALPAGGCDLAENHLKLDRSTNSEMQDYRDGLAPRDLAFAEDTTADGVPELQPYVSDNAQNQKSMPLVSVSVNQTIPLREALFELAKQANFDVQLDPRIKGSVIYTARNKPFDVVIDQLCEIAGLRYKIEDDNMRVELDTPYTKSYKIDYISFIRGNKSSMKTDVSVSGDSSSGAKTGSGFQIESSSESNFWGELDTNIKQILASNSQSNFLRTEEDPQITLTSSNPDLPPAPPIDESALSDVAPRAGIETDYVTSPVSLPSNDPAPTPALPPGVTPATPPDATTPIAPTGTAPAAAPAPMGTAPATAAPQEAVLRVESLPTAASGSPTGANLVTFTPAFSINKQAGIVSVYANERLHRQVESYMQDLRRATSSQVLVEAKVLEVRLNDDYLSGINWQTVAGFLGDIDIDLNLPTPDMNPTNGSNMFSVGFGGNDITALVEQLSRFGTVRALASPRLMVINNQPAVLSVAKNTVYFELDVTQTPATAVGVPPTTTIDTEIKTVPEGVLINVLPSIDLDRNQISMQVRPTVTRIDSFKEDPGIAFLGAGITSSIPELNVQEIDSVVKLRSGQAMVMGGLLEDRTASEQNGVPVLSETPLFGALFRSQSDRVKKTELVIFLKATIIKDEDTSVSNTDRELYRTYGQDRRPTKM